jgi:hypothetical protein
VQVLLPKVQVLHFRIRSDASLQQPILLGFQAFEDWTAVPIAPEANRAS